MESKTGIIVSEPSFEDGLTFLIREDGKSDKTSCMASSAFNLEDRPVKGNRVSVVGEYKTDFIDHTKELPYFLFSDLRILKSN